MCNRFEYEGTFYSISGDYKATPVGSLDCSGEVLPRALTPGLICNANGERELHAMQFGLSPPGCPTPSHPRTPYNNARIESVLRWPWKEAFTNFRCVVPLSAFREPSYWGPADGSEVYFHRVDSGLLHVAAIYRLWTTPDRSKQLYTMSFLMRPASSYVMEHGHHRQPLFIEEDGFDEWLSPERLQSFDALRILRRYAATPELTHRHARDMAPSWTKRQAAAVAKRDEQLRVLTMLEHSCGF